MVAGPNDPGSAYPPPAADIVGGPCWFRANGAPFDAGQEVVLEWRDVTAGLPPFDDADVADGNLISITVPGTYLLGVAATCESDDPTGVNLGLALNGDTAGPLGQLFAHAQLPGDGAETSLHVSGPIRLDEGDNLSATVTADDADVVVTACVLTLLRLTAAPPPADDDEGEIEL